MRHFQLRYFLLWLPILFSMQFLNADSPTIAQVADGGGWQTTIIVTNTSTTAENASLIFFQNAAGGTTVGWNPPFLEVNSTQGLNIPAGSTLFLHTQGTAANTTAGWGQLQASADIVAYAIFTQRVQGRTDQDGTAIAALPSSRLLFPFDNTNGAVATISFANPNASDETVNVSMATSDGITHPTALDLPPFGHTSFEFPKQFPTTSGKSGLAEFYVNSGTFASVPLRFNSSGGFTVAPGYPESGPAVIGASSAAGNPYSFFELSAISFMQGSPDLLFNLNPDNTTYTVYFDDATPQFINVALTNNGMSVSANQLAPNGIAPFGTFLNDFSTTVGTFDGVYKTVSGSLNLTFTPTQTSGQNVSGTFSGTLTLVGTPFPAGGAAVTFTGPVTGRYQAVLK